MLFFTTKENGKVAAESFGFVQNGTDFQLSWMRDFPLPALAVCGEEAPDV
jgi:hypothetical protein